MTRKKINSILIFMTVLFIITLIFTSEIPYPRDIACQYINLCIKSKYADSWNKIFYDISMGGLLSLVFYVLLVRLPEWERRRRIKSSLIRHYDEFKIQCIEQILSITDGRYSQDLPKSLTCRQKFREYFKQDVDGYDDRYYKFVNTIDSNNLFEILNNLKKLRAEIEFTINAIDIYNEDVFKFLKRLIYYINNNTDFKDDYDTEREFTNFLWEIFAGYDRVNGYNDKDYIRNTILSI